MDRLKWLVKHQRPLFCFNIVSFLFTIFLRHDIHPCNQTHLDENSHPFDINDILAATCLFFSINFCSFCLREPSNPRNEVNGRQNKL